jgi:hypothetical protein
LLRSILSLVALMILAIPAYGGDIPPRGVDLDLSTGFRSGPTRVRWFFSPVDLRGAEAAATEQLAGAERVAILSLFDDRWILEAPVDSVASVDAAWGVLGVLAPDESGEAALTEATALVGAGAGFFNEFDLEGDVTSTVAFLDSGCDTAHDDLGDLDENDVDGFPDAGDAADWVDAEDLLSGELGIRIVGWHDVTDDLPLAVGPWDDHFHGTAMASAGFGGGVIDLTRHGVAPEGRFVVVKTWNFEGRWERWASDFFLGVEWLVENAERLRVQACVVGTTWADDHGFEAAVSALADAGILLIAPVGNSGAIEGWPARVPEAFGVGAATKDARLAAYSARAPDMAFPPRVDVVAPGGSSSIVDGEIVVADNEPNDSYRGRTGTSIAAAMVGGAVSIVAEIARESGHIWPTGRDRVGWIGDLLSYTSVELAAAEPGAIGVPPLNRGGYDIFEGHGLIQVRAAMQAVNNILWAGDRADFTLMDPAGGDAVWAARIPGASSAPLTLSLIPSSAIDADLFVFEDTGRGLTPLGSSTRNGTGAAEAVDLDPPPAGDLVVVARRVSGTGGVIFNSLQRFGPSSLWPRELRSRQTTAPVAADLNGDGSLEVILTNTFAVDRRVHEFVVFDARGRTFGFFPRSVDSSPRFGSLSAPAVGIVGGRRMIIAGSDFGQAWALSDSAAVLFSTLLTPGAPLSAPVIWEEGPSARVLFGSQSGIQVLDANGQVVNVIPLGAATAGELAVGDLDADGADEIVAVTDDGLVHAVELDGTALSGWPVALSGTLRSPVLIGTAGQPTVARVIVAQTTVSGELQLHDLGVDGQPSGGSPRVLDLGGFPIITSSAVAAARLGPASTEVVLGAVLGSWNGDQVQRIWRYRPEAGSVVVQELVYSPLQLLGMLHFSRGLILDEPRIVDLSSSPGLEVLQFGQLDWNEAFVGNPRRYGSSRHYLTWSDGAVPQRVAIGPGHESVPEVWGQTPVVTDLESDGFPDFIVVRDNRVYRTGSRMRWTLDGMWAGDRGGRTRTACLDCDGPRFVEAPARPRSLSLRVSPNPFNPRTVLYAELPGAGRVEWSVFDARGRRIREWVETVSGAGMHTAVFDGTDQRGRRLSSGVYFVQVRHASGSARTRIVLVR